MSDLHPDFKAKVGLNLSTRGFIRTGGDWIAIAEHLAALTKSRGFRCFWYNLGWSKTLMDI